MWADYSRPSAPLSNVWRTCTDNHGNFYFSDGFPHVPEIDIRMPQNNSTILNSAMLGGIPVSEFTSGAYNALRYCFACGIIMADVWHRDFSNFSQLSFYVNAEELGLAMDLMDIDSDEYEAMVTDCMDGFVEIINDMNSPDLRRELNLTMIAGQTTGAAIYLRSRGFK